MVLSWCKKAGYFFPRGFYLRNADAKDLLDRFFIAAIASVLLIRFALHVSGYPKLGIGGLHIAHMLLGGFLMLAAIIVLLTALAAPARHMAAILGGIGFGVFIDELGKFITRDNDYFFEPTIAILYVIFILLYLFFRALSPRPALLTIEERLANALETAKKAASQGVTAAEKRYALALLEDCDRKNPLAAAAGEALENIAAAAADEPGFFLKSKLWFAGRYCRLAEKPWFNGAVIFFFLGSSLVGLLQAMLLVKGAFVSLLAITLIGLAAIGFFRANEGNLPLARIFLYLFVILLSGLALRASFFFFPAPELAFIDWGEIFFTVLSGFFALIGVLRLARSRLAAYRMFERAILVSVFLTQFFVFYKNQLSAVFGLFLNIVILEALRYWIRQEEHLGAERKARLAELAPDNQ